MAATQAPPAWVAATGASSVHSLEDPTSHCFLSSDAAGPPSILAQDASIHADAPPNPPFVFPARLSSPSSAPALYASAGGRRPVSGVEPRRSSSPLSENGDRRRRTMALPAFNFNPGASLALEHDSLAFLSPPITPNSTMPKPFPSPSRAARHGHRRGGSEFVGGSIRDGNSIAVMSTSPTKSDSGFASPGLAPPTRGHRRVVSGIICASDLPLLRPFPEYNMLRGNSAPNSPTSFELQRDTIIGSQGRTTGLPAPMQVFGDSGGVRDATLNATRPTTPAALSFDAESSSPRQPRSARTRVGFSDKLEFIPRPLSMVSSDTSSTATARPGHSVSGSISSVVSVTYPCDRESPVTLPRSSTRDFSDSRPSTAGAILEHMAAPPNRNVANTSLKRRNSNPTLLSVAEAQAADLGNPVATVKTPKRWSFFGLESSFISPAVATKPRPSSSSSSESTSRAASAPSSSDHDSDSTETGRDLGVANTDKQFSKKMSRKKRVKGWAGSILPLKPRGQKKPLKANGMRPPTPPASVDPLEDDGDEDDDETEEMEDSETPDPEATSSKDWNADSSASEREIANPQPDTLSKDDASHPMIDLDAALGPFNTPLPHNAWWEAAQRAGSTTGKRRMHSAQGMKGFSGPGMHYHRRSESAPDLPPFDPGRSSIHRLNSNPAMADVFEEDEDEDVAVTNKQPQAAILTESHGDGASSPPDVLPSIESSPLLRASPFEPTQATTKRASSEPIECMTPYFTALATQGSNTSVPGEATVDDPPSIVFCSPNASGPDSASSSPKRLPGTKELSPAEVFPTCHNNMAMMPLCPYSTSLASSSHPSPRSPMSVDAQLMSTAPSSVTDKNSFQSLLMGEPGPEVRLSADYDIRSLTSSNSTMTRDSSFIPSQRMSQPTLREQRPVSVSSAAFGRRRSSLVSLSRLISSAHGERSKLSMEVTLDNEPEGKRSRSKGSKTKERLGRMMQFWKPSKGGAPA